MPLRKCIHTSNTYIIQGYMALRDINTYNRVKNQMENEIEAVIKQWFEGFGISKSKHSYSSPTR